MDPFRLVPVGQLADIADKFTRNEIVSSNEFRATIGFKASDDPRADQLINKNMPVDQIQPGYSDEVSDLEGMLDPSVEDELSESEKLLAEMEQGLNG